MGLLCFQPVSPAGGCDPGPLDERLHKPFPCLIALRFDESKQAVEVFSSGTPSARRVV